MDEAGEYHDMRHKPMSKKERKNDLTDKRMMTRNGGWKGRQEWRKEGLYRGKREVGGLGGKEKNYGMNQTSLLYVNV